MFIERYAEPLSKGGVIKIFNEVLVGELGSIAKACREAGIERKTIYNWRHATYLKRATKLKVVQAAFKLNPLKTLRLIIENQHRELRTLLFTIIDYTRARATQASSKEELLDIANNLREILTMYSRPITEYLTTEINDAKATIEQKAIELGISPEKIWPEDHRFVNNNRISQSKP